MPAVSDFINYIAKQNTERTNNEVINNKEKYENGRQSLRNPREIQTISPADKSGTCNKQGNTAKQPENTRLECVNSGTK